MEAALLCVERGAGWEWTSVRGLQRCSQIDGIGFPFSRSNIFKKEFENLFFVFFWLTSVDIVTKTMALTLLPFLSFLKVFLVLTSSQHFLVFTTPRSFSTRYAWIAWPESGVLRLRTARRGPTLSRTPKRQEATCTAPSTRCWPRMGWPRPRTKPAVSWWKCSRRWL